MKAFNVVAFKDIAPCTESHWLIKDLIMPNSLVVLYGDSNLGKSFLALDMAFSIATGKDFLGRPTKQGATFIFAAEGGSLVNNRFEAIRRHHEIADAPLYLINSVADFFSSDGDAKALLLAIKTKAASDNQTPALVVIDTLTKVSRGANQNSQQDMGKVLANAELIQRELACTVILIHHGSKDSTRGSRGTNTLQCDVDTEIHVTPNALTVTKQRDAERAAKIGFELKTVEIGKDAITGEALNSCVVIQSKSMPPDKISTRAQQALEALRIVSNGFGAKVSVQAWGQRFKELYLAGLKPNAKTNAFNRASTELFAKGLVATESDYAWKVTR